MSKGGGVSIEVLLMNIVLLNYWQECKENANNFKDVIQQKKKLEGIIDAKILGILPTL